MKRNKQRNEVTTMTIHDGEAEPTDRQLIEAICNNAAEIRYCAQRIVRLAEAALVVLVTNLLVIGIICWYW